MQKFYRIYPSSLVFVLYLLFIILYYFNKDLYILLIKLIGIFPESRNFYDGSFIVYMKQCHEMGYDVFKEIPCMNNNPAMGYSPLWPLIPIIPSNPDYILHVSFVTTFIFCSSLYFLPQIRTKSELILISLALPSYPIIFGIERNNVDTWIFPFIIIALYYFSSNIKLRVISYTVFLFFGLLKYYPLILLNFLFKEKRLQIFFTISIVISLIIFFFFVIFYREIYLSLTRVPSGSPFNDFFGMRNIPLVLSMLEPSYSIYIYYLSKLILICTIFYYAYKIASNVKLKYEYLKISHRSRNLLTGVSFILTGCYILIHNIGYRAIYLLPVFFILVESKRNIYKICLQKRIIKIMFLVIFLLWENTLRNLIEISIPDISPIVHLLLSNILWTLREFSWTLIITCLLAIIIIEFENTLLINNIFVKCKRFFEPKK